MVEYNLLREGFIYNTRTPLGTISGSQVVSATEIDRLFDNDIGTTALVVTGTQFISLDADLGARWKLRRIELHTNETQPLDFYMLVSDDNLDFTPVTMTGAAPLWVGELPDSTISGAPRYLRYEHRPASNVNVMEWKAISDDSFVDFGTTGAQTSLEITDAPVGQPSTQVTPLTLFNRYGKVADASVFVDRTEADADNEIEIGLSTTGPWVGRRSPDTRQPSVLPWSAGNAVNTRVVPECSYKVDFKDGTLKSWAGSGATVSGFAGNLRATSTNFTPLVGISNDFMGNFVSPALFYNEQAAFFKDYFVFPAVDVDKVKVRARVLSSIPPGVMSEGPRLFWRTQDPETGTLTFRNQLSTLSNLGNSPFTGQEQEFIFDVSAVPTWSGSIRALGFRPFTVTSGTGHVFDVHGVEAYHSSGEQVALDFRPVSSGSFPPDLSPEGAQISTTVTIALSTRNVIMQDCVITKVIAVVSPGDANNNPYFFLARPTPGSVFPAIGNNFTVIHAVRPPESSSDQNFPRQIEVPVFWGARRGDIIGIRTAGNFTSHAFISEGAVLGDCWTTTSGTAITSLVTLQNALNTTVWTPQALRPLIHYEAHASAIERSDQQGPFVSLGTYTTPVFRSQVSPTLNTLEFEATEPSGSSIDSLTEQGIRTVEARASDSAPLTALPLGQLGTVSGSSPTHVKFLNWEAALFGQQNVLQLNTQNGLMTGAVGSFVQNVGAAILYHELKDELWVLNNTISGTNPFSSLNCRPAWDVFNPHTGDYVRTQHVTGNIFYSYTHPTTPAAFEPVGFVADYGRQEIYIFQRENAFFVGAGSYYGIVLDLDGNFKDVFWRQGATDVPNTNRFETTQAFTYAPTLQAPPNQVTSSGIFFTLSDDDLVGVEDPEFLIAYRNGSDSDPRDIRFINQRAIALIPGLTWASSSTTRPKGLVYNSRDGLLYLYFEFVNSTIVRDGYFYALQPSYDELTGTFNYAVVSSGTAFDSQPRFSGFSREQAISADDPWVGTRERTLTYTSGMAYVSSRDTYALLRTYTGRHTPNFPFAGATLFGKRSLSFLVEVGAGLVPKLAAPQLPHPTDGLWGTLSGTLGFQTISTQGINFPTGQYTQVRYQLNSNLTRTVTPSLVSSALADGLAVGSVPSSGTRDIFVRTNIPADKPVGDQQGRIKVYWALEEE